VPTKITVIYDNPEDPAAFETGYADGLVDSARLLPGLRHVETAKVWPKEDGSPTPAYRTIDLYFADYDTACAAVTTPERVRCSRSSSGWAPVASGSCSPTWRSPNRSAERVP